MNKVFTLRAVAARSRLQPEEAVQRLTYEIDQRRLVALDSVRWSEKRAANGRILLRGRSDFAEIRITSDALAAWARSYASLAADLFTVEVLAHLAPIGALMEL